MPREARVTSDQLATVRAMFQSRPFTASAVAARLGMQPAQLAASFNKWGLAASDAETLADALAELAKFALDCSVDVREAARLARRAKDEAGRRNFARLLAADPIPGDDDEVHDDEVSLSL